MTTAANFKARASNPGPCALASCCMSGDKIYEGLGFRLRACTQGHADAVVRILDTPPDGMDRATFEELRPAALHAMREKRNA